MSILTLINQQGNKRLLIDTDTDTVSVETFGTFPWSFLNGKFPSDQIHPFDIVFNSNTQCQKASMTADGLWLMERYDLLCGDHLASVADDEYVYFTDDSGLTVYPRLSPFTLGTPMTTALPVAANGRPLRNGSVFFVPLGSSPWVAAFEIVSGALVSRSVSHDLTYTTGTNGNGLSKCGEYFFMPLSTGGTTMEARAYRLVGGVMDQVGSLRVTTAQSATPMVFGGGSAGFVVIYSLTNSIARFYSVSGGVFTQVGSDLTLSGLFLNLNGSFTLSDPRYIALKSSNDIRIYKMTGSGLTHLHTENIDTIAGGSRWSELVQQGNVPTPAFYSGATTEIVNGNVNLSTLKLMLLDEDAVFDSNDATVDAVSNSGTDEIYGNGWPQGGATLTGVTFATNGANKTILDADDLIVNITSATLTAGKAVIYDDTSNKPLIFLDFTPTLVSAGETFQFIWDSENGIISFV